MTQKYRVKADNKTEEVLKRRINGESVRGIAKKTNISKSAIHRYLTKSSVLGLLKKRDQEKLMELLSEMICDFSSEREILRRKIHELDVENTKTSTKLLKDLINTTQNLNDKNIRLFQLLLPSKMVSVEQVKQQDQKIISFENLR